MNFIFYLLLMLDSSIALTSLRPGKFPSIAPHFQPGLALAVATLPALQRNFASGKNRISFPGVLPQDRTGLTPNFQTDPFGGCVATSAFGDGDRTLGHA